MNEEIKSEKILVEKNNNILPLIAIKGTAIFPGMVLHFDLSHEKSLKALATALESNRQIFLVEQKFSNDNPDEFDFYEYGCLAEIKQSVHLENQSIRVLVEVKNRGKIRRLLDSEPYFVVAVDPILGKYAETKEAKILFKLIVQSFKDYLRLTNADSNLLEKSLETITDPELLVDLIAANLDLDTERSQDLLSESDVRIRLSKLYHFLIEETEFLEMEQTIDERVHNELDRNQREFVLREQIRVIQEELGESEETQIQQYYEKLNTLIVPDIVREKVDMEITRLRKMAPGSSEAGVIESYLDWVLDLPWNQSDELNIDIKEARKILDEDHYGLETVKERILEYLSVLHLTNSLESPIICLVGAPGVGKTSIAKSIARATGRKFTRLSLGGMRDEAEIRGHRRTYLGSIPGRIIYQIRMTKSNNPLFLLDEIDKVSYDFKGDPYSALLEVLDPEQNNTFTDNFIELPFDLSKVFFITTANSTSYIPEALLDRMEVIEVNGYIENEKVHIAQKFLIPELLEKHGLTNKTLRIHKSALIDIISFYTRESGVRNLKRTLAKICRIAAKKIVEEDQETVVVKRSNLEEFLGKKKYLVDKVTRKSEIGCVNGLAWTEDGGETLEIEVNSYPGEGKLKLTGQLGEVMQESAQAAFSYLKSQTKDLGIPEKYFDENDFHLHVPEGAIPKDGPSAGITMATALLSLALNKPVNKQIAMTGEITLRGKVLPIGGLREKSAAAYRAGIKTIYFPKENERDLDEIPQELKDDLNYVPVSHMSNIIKELF